MLHNLRHPKIISLAVSVQQELSQGTRMLNLSERFVGSSRWIYGGSETRSTVNSQSFQGVYIHLHESIL